MATIPVGAAHTIAAPRAARRRYRVLREAPVIPLVILGVLTSVAVLAPVLAPHGKLDPVAPTREQCLAKYSIDRKSTRLNSSHVRISYAVFCLKKKKEYQACYVQS